ncbi:uncharacterized protein LOC115752266 isoform X3 [Rhodamnia argentea]|uniref:Uncharacterized protein LOC115752266 isoform X3 n=1 Tax=Rhodamnia argentea TaxID=178133 RepID=A0A8B8QI78_9MYRT|nr:uncharacterized protein LOC115752266 isoform X3 [Rhodamnia argentea]
MAMEVAVSTNFCGYPRRNPFVIHRQRPTSTVKGFGQNSIIPKTRIRRSCHVLAANNPKSDDKGSSCGDSYTSQISICDTTVQMGSAADPLCGGERGGNGEVSILIGGQKD